MLLAHHTALEEQGLAGSLTDTARGLVLEALAAHSKGILVSAAARRAHLRVTAFVLHKTRGDLQATLAEIDNQISILESSPCPCCGRPMSEHDADHR
jgi:hypothetical protein